MKEKEGNHIKESRLLGDKRIRIPRQSRRRRLRITPNIPEVVRFIGEVTRKTPLIPLLIALTAAWLLFSWGIYLVEHKSDEQLSTYPDALWWSFTAMHTQGANIPGPITLAGKTLGATWSIFSTMAFFGVIIGILYSYFMQPHRRPSQELVRAIQYNLDELENLSVVELEALKEITASLVDTRISRLSDKS